MDTKNKTQQMFENAEKPFKQAKAYWHMLGPGLTTGASDDDPAGVVTYSQTGSRYGFQLLWLATLTFPFMAVVQEMCARIGLVTGRGLAANIRLHYPRWVLYTCSVLLFAANSFNIGADLGAMAQATQLLFPNFNFSLVVIVFAVLSVFMQIYFSYGQYAKYLKWLALILFSYIASSLVIGLDWKQVFYHAVVPSITWSKDQIILICAILGTTISPYLFFWQTSQEVEEQILDGKTSIKARVSETTPKEIRKMRIDVWSGMFLSNLVMFFIIAASGATLYANGITNIETAADAAQALKPFAGNFSYLLFVIGIIGTGLLAVPVLAGSASYALSESFGWKEGLYRKFKQAHAFYAVIIVSMLVGLLSNFIGLDPIRALIYSAVANGLVAPIVLVLIVLLARNKKIMGEHAISKFTQGLGWLIVSIMTISGLAVIWAII
jgi:NRAMP (natural resistance-associated macrophage protein)-like metal ion transporter